MKKTVIIICIQIVCLGCLCAASQTATIRINSNVTHQKITGFGGFVNSPQFGYNHMSANEIRLMWGKSSEAGYNIMRLYIPIGEENWSQCLSTAKLAKELGLIVFASPWSMPAIWKTNNSINGVVTDDDGVDQVGYLKREHFEDYANYLNNFVTYLRDNGVELDAISIQNEPDYTVSYAGCRFSPEEMATFIKEYGHLIHCKLIAPETVGMPDSYANALLADDVIDKLGIFAGHQYGAMQTTHKNFHAKGKEVWMTEYLINWNESQSAGRDVDYSMDVFNFADAINTCMMSDINAWIHYATKRYYGMMGDGTNGAPAGEMTKRGYVLSHYAKYVTGTTRIEGIWSDDSNTLKGSAYLSSTSDSVVVMVINPSNDAYRLTIDLPFFTLSGKSIVTTSARNMEETSIALDEESCRPKVDVDASSVSTFIFTKNSDREASQMTGKAVYHSNIETRTITNPAFGTGHQLSNQTKTFDVNTPLISANKNANNGYLRLDNRYNRLVFEIVGLISANQYNSDNTTLHYVNKQGAVASHNYGKIEFNRNGSSVMVLDISADILPDGCSGILGITNSNYSSVLTITFGDVYFSIDNEKMYQFTGVYSKGESDLLGCMDDLSFTSLDFTGVEGITSEQNWQASAVNKNCIYYVGSDIANNQPNVISGATCCKLELTDDSGNFYSPFDFTASFASFRCALEGYKLLTLPFEAAIPDGVSAYTLLPTPTEIKCTPVADGRILANTPVLVKGDGLFSFEGSGVVSSPLSLNVNGMQIVYISSQAPKDSYYLHTIDGEIAFYRVAQDVKPTIGTCSAYLDFGSAATSDVLPLVIEDDSPIEQIDAVPIVLYKEYYNLMGQKLNMKSNPLRGVHIERSYLSNGRVRSEKVIIF